MVSKTSLRRALRILDALIKELLERGFEVCQGDDSFEILIDGERLGFGISEEVITEKTQPKNTGLDGYYQFGHSSFDYVRVPSGRLCLTIHDWFTRERKVKDIDSSRSREMLKMIAHSGQAWCPVDALGSLSDQRRPSVPI